MADPLSIVGGVAAILQISDCLTTSVRRLRHCIKTVRYAPQEVKQVRDQVSVFTTSLQLFYDYSVEFLNDMEDSLPRKTRRNLIAGLIRQCRTVQKGFEEL